MKFSALLHTAERPKRSFSRFCTLQKGQKEVFHASAHCRKAKKEFFTLLHTAERPKKKIFAHGESRFPKGLAFPRTAKVVSRRVWRARESFVYKNEKIDEVGKVRLWH